MSPRPRTCLVCDEHTPVNAHGHRRWTCSALCLSEAHRRRALDALEDHGSPSAPVIARFHRNARRWAAMVLEEHAAGPGYTARLARRWRMTHTQGARVRIVHLVAHGYLTSVPPNYRRPTQCGTTAGAARHRRAGEKPCEPCREAWNTYHRDLKRRRRSA
jgi:hypothetical protein